MNKKLVISILITIFLLMLLNKLKNNNSEHFADAQPNIMLWDNKKMSLPDIIIKLRKEWNQCGVAQFDLEPQDFSIINSRKRLIELLPVTKMITKLTYDNIKCFVNTYDPDNYLVISKVVSTVPKIIKPVNMMIINNILYKSTPHGVLKYIIPALQPFAGINSLNAALEAGILNDYNTYNQTNEPICTIDGLIIQRKGDNFFDLKNGDFYKITDITDKVELLNTKLINKIEEEKKANQSTIATQQQAQSAEIKKVKESMIDVGGTIELNVKNYSLLKKIDKNSLLPEVPINKNEVNIGELVRNLVTIIEFGGVLYMVEPTIIRPASIWAITVNDMLKKNKLQIKGIIPHYYHSNNNFYYRLLVILSDNFYLIVEKSGVSEIKDSIKDFNISFNPNVPDSMNCDDLKIILQQMKQANIVTDAKINDTIKFYRC